MIKHSQIAVLFFALVSCGANGSQNSGSQYIEVPKPNFSFAGLSVDLNGISQVGVKTGSSQRNGLMMSNQSISNGSQAELSYLIGLNEAGELSQLQYKSQTNQTVAVPYSIYSVEVAGDYSLLVYYLPSFESALISIQDTMRFTSSSRILETTKFEILFKQFGMSYEGYVEFIVMHNASGKLFDIQRSLELAPPADLVDSFFGTILSFRVYEDKIYYFSRRANPESNTCNGRLIFNTLTNNLDRVESCTTLQYDPIFVHENGYFAYILNSEVNFASFDLSITGTINDYIDYNFGYKKQFIKSVNETIVLVKGDGNFVTFSSTFEYTSISTNEPLLNNLEPSAWISTINGYDYYRGGEMIYKVNFSNQTVQNKYIPGFLDRHSQLNGYDFVEFEGNFFILGDDLYDFNLETMTETLLDQSIYNYENDYFTYSTTGYMTYAVTNGLTQVNKSINLQSKTIYLQSENKPTISVTQIRPIN
jgi:hypothetical protein